MQSLPDSGRQELAPDEAYQRCKHELERPHPDYEAAQVFATLSLEEAVRDMSAQLAQVARQLVVSSRHR